MPATPDSVHFGPGSPYGAIHENPIFEAEEMENLDENLDDIYNYEPLRFRTMSDIIEPAVPSGQVPRDMWTNESDRLFAVSAEKPSWVVEATQKAVWHRTMVDEQKAIEENKTWSLTKLLW